MIPGYAHDWRWMFHRPAMGHIPRSHREASIHISMDCHQILSEGWQSSKNRIRKLKAHSLMGLPRGHRLFPE